MKKVMLVLTAVGIAAAANAKILRVSNVSGSSAPYTTIAAAHDAASTGDTIMVDISPKAYDGTTLTKKVVLIGAGYWLVDNGILSEGASSAMVGEIKTYAEGTTICGIDFTGAGNNNVIIYGSKTVVKRCRVQNVHIASGVSNCVIHQNFIGNVVGDSYEESSYHQITNNIFRKGNFRNIDNSYIAYNTFALNKVTIFSSKDNTFEKNLWKSHDEESSCTFNDNYEGDNLFPTVTDYKGIDSDVYNNNLTMDIRNKYGAFAGDSPYVLSGVPAGPVIQDMIVPTTVELGSKLNVTIKVGVQQ
ncbi:MAG: hypothetical protein IJK15_01615 [Bacteroidaceae bacterium]|nr:hypothetical protein [Bacteroidaceae bacterium]